MPWVPEADPASTWTDEDNPDFSDAEVWRMPTASNENILASIALMDLRVGIEDMTENVEDIQANRNDWTVVG